MKKVMVFGLALLAVVAMVGTGFAIEEKDEIAKRHEKWMKQVRASEIHKSKPVVMDNQPVDGTVTIAALPVQTTAASRDAATFQTTLPSGSGDITITTDATKGDTSWANLTGFTSLTGGTITIGTSLVTASTVQPTLTLTRTLLTIGTELATRAITIPTDGLATLTTLTPITAPDTRITIPQYQGATLNVTTTATIIGDRDAVTFQTTLPTDSGDLRIASVGTKGDTSWANLTGIGGTIGIKTAPVRTTTVMPEERTTALRQLLPTDQPAISTRTITIPESVNLAAKTELDQILAVTGRIAQNNTQNASFTVVSTIATNAKAQPMYMARQEVK